MEEIKEPSEYFYARNGAVLKNLGELLEVLRTIDNDTFEHHFNENKNDFANWTENALKEPKIAKKMYAAKARDELYGIVEKALKMKVEKKGEKAIPKKTIISKIKEAIQNG
ncbi:MAG: hypothetical protein KKB62_02655 [Nanoarchaeota archaeon]|nr:hypothetical protein [Nanoarchaeota archaeon]